MTRLVTFALGFGLGAFTLAAIIIIRAAWQFAVHDSPNHGESLAETGARDHGR